jgi:hypothetical protein
MQSRVCAALGRAARNDPERRKGDPEWLGAASAEQDNGLKQ